MIKVDATLNAAGFLAGLKAMDAGVLGFVNTCKAMTTILPGLGAIIAAMGVFKHAIDMGGELTDLSAQTGQPIKDLVVLQQALKNAGISAESARPLLQKFQANLADASEGTGTAAHALEKLGVTASDLRAKSAVDQMETLQKGLAGVTDQADRAQILRDLFGKKGGQLGSLLGDPEAFDQARKQLGGLPGLLEKLAPFFDAIGDAVGALGIKLTQLATGALSMSGEQISGFMTELSQVDLTGIGEALGVAVRLGSTLFLILKPLVQLLGAISNGFHQMIADYMGTSEAVKPIAPKLGGEDAFGSARDSSPVTHIASAGGSFGGGGFAVDIPSRIDRTNDLLADIRSFMARPDQAPAPHQRPNLAV